MTIGKVAFWRRLHNTIWADGHFSCLQDIWWFCPQSSESGCILWHVWLAFPRSWHLADIQAPVDKQFLICLFWLMCLTLIFPGCMRNLSWLPTPGCAIHCKLSLLGNLFEVSLFYRLQLFQQNRKLLSTFHFTCPCLQIRCGPNHIKRDHLQFQTQGR